MLPPRLPAVSGRGQNTPMDRLETSPLAVYTQHLERGELAYQVSRSTGAPVFYPRVAAPRTGAADLEWRISAGLGTVYATTVVHPRDGTPYNVALVDVDEGFRLMSRVVDVAPSAVRIGMRVRVHIHPGDEKEPPYPVFTPAESA